jgi:hypothetical protein
VASPLNRWPGGPRRGYRGALGLWLALAAVPATAQTTSLTGPSLLYSRPSNAYGGNYLSAVGGLVYTDNVERTAGGTGETLLLLGLSGDTTREGPRLDYHLSSNLAVLKYLGGAYPTEPSGYLDGMLAFHIVPGLFSWIARESFSEVLIDQYTPTTPNNLVNLNIITTGPRFTLRPTLRTSVRLDALYSYLTSSSPAAQFTSIDSHRYGGDLRIDRAFSETASLYLKAHYEKVDFKDQVDNHNYSVGDAVAGYQLTDGRTVFNLSGGYSQLRIYDVLSTVEGAFGSRETLTTEKFDEPIWMLNLSRLITPSQRIALTVSQQLTDAASSFRLGFDQPVPTVPPTLFASGEPFKQREYILGWRFEAARTTLDLSLLELQARFLLDTGNSYNNKFANATLTRLLSPALSGDVAASFGRTEQVGAPTATAGVPILAGQSANTWGVLADLRWQVGERLALRFIYSHSEQQGVYKDNQVGVTASWALLGAAPRTQSAPLSPISPASMQAPAAQPAPLSPISPESPQEP